MDEKLIKHYHDSFGATQVSNSLLFIIEEDASKKLLEKYSFEME